MREQLFSPWGGGGEDYSFVAEGGEDGEVEGEGGAEGRGSGWGWDWEGGGGVGWWRLCGCGHVFGVCHPAGCERKDPLRWGWGLGKLE